MKVRVAVSVAVWTAVAIIGSYALGGDAGLASLAVAVVAMVVIWQAVWITASWVTTGDPRWWR